MTPYTIVMLHENPLLDGKIQVGVNLPTTYYSGTPIELYKLVCDTLIGETDLDYNFFADVLRMNRDKNEVTCVIIEENGLTFRLGSGRPTP